LIVITRELVHELMHTNCRTWFDPYLASLGITAIPLTKRDSPILWDQKINRLVGGLLLALTALEVWDICGLLKRIPGRRQQTCNMCNSALHTDRSLHVVQFLIYSKTTVLVVK